MSKYRLSLPLLGVILLAGIALWLMLAYRLVDSDISDSIGYVQASHQLARGEGLAFVDPHNEIDRRYYTLYAFRVIRPGDPNRYFGLPPGVPVLAAAVEKVTGDPGAVHVLVPVLAAVLIASTYLLGTLLVNAWVGLWAALALAVTPTFLRFSTAFYSETPSAAFLYLGFVLCTIALRRVRDDGWAIRLAIAGGLAIGMTFFMRFSSTSVLPALPVLVWAIGGRSAFRQRRVVALAVAVLIALLALFVFNAAYYGGPFITGYSPIHGWYDQPPFSLAYAFGRSFIDGYSIPAIASQLVKDLSWLLVFAVVGLAARSRRIAGWMLSLSIFMLAPYAVYAFAATGLNARFVIPALPPLCLLVGQGIAILGNRLPGRAWRWLLGAALVVGMFYNLPSDLAALEVRNQAAQSKIMRVQDLVAPTEPNAVVMSYALNDLVAVYGHRSVLNYRQMPPYDPASAKYHYDRFEELLVDEVDRLLHQGTPVYYILDGNPPLYHSDEVLRRHFKLDPVITGDVLFRVERQG